MQRVLTEVIADTRQFKTFADQLAHVNNRLSDSLSPVSATPGSQHLLHGVQQTVVIHQHYVVELQALSFIDRTGFQCFQIETNASESRFESAAYAITKPVIFLLPPNL